MTDFVPFHFAGKEPHPTWFQPLSANVGRIFCWIFCSREAFAKMRSAVRDVLFPAGTWRLFRELGVNVVGCGSIAAREIDVLSGG